MYRHSLHKAGGEIRSWHGSELDDAAQGPASIWKNDRLGKSGYPGISQYKFSEMGYPRITWDKLDRLA